MWASCCKIMSCLSTQRYDNHRLFAFVKNIFFFFFPHPSQEKSVSQVFELNVFSKTLKIFYIFKHFRNNAKVFLWQLFYLLMFLTLFQVGFWTIRVDAQGQTKDLRIKVEKHYLPPFELVVAMPSFALDTDEFLEASVEGAFITERIAKGNVTFRWLAKKIDYQTPMYNDTVIYREVFQRCI